MEKTHLVNSLERCPQLIVKSLFIFIGSLVLLSVSCSKKHSKWALRLNGPVILTTNLSGMLGTQTISANAEPDFHILVMPVLVNYSGEGDAIINHTAITLSTKSNNESNREPIYLSGVAISMESLDKSLFIFPATIRTGTAFDIKEKGGILYSKGKGEEDGKITFSKFPCHLYLAFNVKKEQIISGDDAPNSIKGLRLLFDDFSLNLPEKDYITISDKSKK